MAFISPAPAFCIPDLPRLKRGLGVLLISILLHFVAIHWARIQVPPSSLRNFNIVHATLPATAAQEPVASPAMVADSKPKRPHVITPTEGHAARSTKQTVTKTITPSVATNQAASTSAQTHNAMQYSIDLPPSAELRFDVIVLKNGNSFQGQSTITWQSDGSQYSADTTTDIAGIGTRSSQSEGTIDQFGLAPVLYTEKSSNKSATNTHFQHERNLISFSSSTVNYPLQGGEQDRASIIWQLAAIARGTPKIFVPDADIDIFIAGVRDGETWRMHVLGEEEIGLPTGAINAWHLVRMPRVGTYEQRLDIWLAPQQAWYPVKLRFTQANGDTLDMSLSKTNSVLAH